LDIAKNEEKYSLNRKHKWTLQITFIYKVKINYDWCVAAVITPCSFQAMGREERDNEGLVIVTSNSGRSGALLPRHLYTIIHTHFYHEKSNFTLVRERNNSLTQQ
jgi:hypothetical protein